MINRAADDVFLSVFLKLTNQGHRLSPKPCATYAAKRMAEHGDAKGYTKKKRPKLWSGYLMPGCCESKPMVRRHVVMTCWW
jgi:hypothetical protein